MRFNSRQLKGLTLVELLIVLGIITALSAIALAIINPNKQRNRARDGVLKNSIASLGQSIDSFYGLKGYYPDADTVGGVEKYLELDRYIEVFTMTNPTTKTIVFTSPSVSTGGVAGGPITYYVNDFNGDTIKDLPCLEAASNENPTQFIAWAPGYAVTTLVQGFSCADSSGTGYTELTGLDPTP